MVGTGLTMTSLEDCDLQKLVMYSIHGMIGLLVALAAIERIVFHLRQSKLLPEGMSESWKIWIYHITHSGIYLVLLGSVSQAWAPWLLKGITFLNVDPAALNRDIAPVQRHFVLTRLYMLLFFMNIGSVLCYIFAKSDILSRMGLHLPIGKTARQ